MNKVTYAYHQLLAEQKSVSVSLVQRKVNRRVQFIHKLDKNGPSEHKCMSMFPFWSACRQGGTMFGDEFIDLNEASSPYYSHLICFIPQKYVIISYLQGIYQLF